MSKEELLQRAVLIGEFVNDPDIEDRIDTCRIMTKKLQKKYGKLDLIELKYFGKLIKNYKLENLHLPFILNDLNKELIDIGKQLDAL